VNRAAVTREYTRYALVRQPSAVLDARRLQRPQSLLGIPDAKDLRAQCQRGDRVDQKFLQLRAALFVAPIADPYHIPFAR
jgi:hypothetical protein